MAGVTSFMPEQQKAQIWSRELQNARSPELPAGPATARERRTAEQGIAGQCGRCTGPGSRTVVHLTVEHAQRMP